MQVSSAGVFSRIRFGPQHVVLALLSLLLIGQAAASLPWRIDGDLAWELYVARLVDAHGLIPYRDIYVIDMPGTILTYTAIGRAIGYTGDLAMRLVDLGCLAGLAALTWLWLRRLSHTVAWAAVVLFGLTYLGAGDDMSLQREYLLLLPILGSVVLATSAPRLDDRARSALVGLLFGGIATVKPQAALALPVVFVFMLLELKARHGGLARQQVIRLGLWAAGGAALPLLAMILYLAFSGALPYYLNLLANYAPLYAQTSHQLTIVTGAERPAYLYEALVSLNGKQVWLMPAAVGVMTVSLPGLYDDHQRRQVWLAGALLVSYLVYPALTGQFFAYHWLPFAYFVMILAALCAAPAPAALGRWLRAFPMLSLALALILRYGLVTDAIDLMNERFVLGDQPGEPSSARPQDIAAYARAHFAPGDGVQPLDWGNGAMGGLLLADVPPASRFVFDTVFFYDVQSDYIQELRREFIQKLEGDSAPRWIVYVAAQPEIKGAGTSYKWPELQGVIDSAYQPVFFGYRLLIYQRSEGVSRGLIAYPMVSKRTFGGFLKLPDDNILWVTDDQADDRAALDEDLAEFSGRHTLLTAETMSLEADRGVIETWLGQNTYKIDEQQISTRIVANYLNLPGCAGDLRPVGASFGDDIRLDSAAVSTARVGSQEYLCAELSWAAARPVGQFYKVAAHIFNADGELVAQYDGVPMAGFAPTNTWTPGQPVPDRFAIRLPDGLPAGEYAVNVVLYDPGSGQRVPVGGADSLLISRVTIAAP